MKELEDTFNNVKSEQDDKEAQLKTCNGSLKKIEQQISDIVEKELNPLKAIIASYVKYKRLTNNIEEIGKLNNGKTREIVVFQEARKEKKETLNYDCELHDDIMKSFCDEIKNTLKEFGYNSVETVTFNAKEQDIAINGIPRMSNGKGYRAFFYTAFSVALLNYLSKKEHKFTRILILDSPVTTLKEEEINSNSYEKGDLIDSSLQDSLFNYLATNFMDKQIIIMENKELNTDTANMCNNIKFTENRQYGRYGFFPCRRI